MKYFNEVNIDDILGLTEDILGSSETIDLDKLKKTYISDYLLDSYRDIYNYRGFLRGIKGSRASGKSKYMAYEMPLRIMKYPWANGLVIRKTNISNKRSTIKEILSCIDSLGVSDLWTYRKLDNEIVYNPTGQVIYFAGLDEPEKITSITVEKGVLAFVWFEEFSQVKDEEDFDKIIQSIRGFGNLNPKEIPSDFFKQVTVTLNPWDFKHFSKSRIFDSKDLKFAQGFTTTMLDNPYLTDMDKKLFSQYLGTSMEAPAILGEWGNSEGQVFDNVEVRNITKDEVRNLESFYGLDFGSNDPTAFIHCKINHEKMELYIIDEFYKVDIDLNEVAQLIIDKGYQSKIIYADNQAKQSIKTLKNYHMLNIKGCKKTRIVDGINFLKTFKIIIDSSCVNAIDEFDNYIYNSRASSAKLYLGADHLIDALRYSLTKFYNNDNLRNKEGVVYRDYIYNIFKR